MNENRELTHMIQLEIQRQLHEHFFEKALMCQSTDMIQLEKMVLGELASYIQTGIHEIIEVFMDEKEPIPK